MSHFHSSTARLSPQVLQSDPRHVVAFPRVQAVVWVMASCAVTQTSQLPDECSKQLTSLGYKVKPTSWSISVFPKETSHQYVDGASKLKICASLYRKLHKKEPKEKKPLICPHCNKEAGGVVTAPVSYSALAVPDPFHGGAPENLKMHRLFISTIQWFLAFAQACQKPA